jgi:hypothetical protein
MVTAVKNSNLTKDRMMNNAHNYSRYHRHKRIDSNNLLDSYRRRNMSPVKYELGFYIPEVGILHSHCRENLKS